MNDRGIVISYGDVAIGAKENFTPSMEDYEETSDFSALTENAYAAKNFGNPCEPYSVFLDGKSEVVPSESGIVGGGIWSSSLSGEDGYFDNPISLRLSSEEYFTSSGITMYFDEEEEIYPSEVLVRWYQDGSVVAENVFYPNSSQYFFNQRVDNYDEIDFSFIRLNTPQNRLKIRGIEYGIGVYFYGNELRRAVVIQEIDPISSQISINAFDFDLDSKRNIDFSFQSKQPVYVRFDGELIAKCFVERSKRKSQNYWSVEAQDYIGLMENIPFAGGVYVNKNAFELAGEIFGAANVPFSFSENLKSETVSGYIPYTNCRYALMQLCFAIAATVDTSGLDLVSVFSLTNEVSQKISKSRVMINRFENKKNSATEVQLFYHGFSRSDEVAIAYDYQESGVGEGITVIFSEPLHDLSIVSGEIIERGENYAVINALDGCVLTGKKYNHVKTQKTKRNPFFASGEAEKIVTIKDATLVSKENVDKILLLCYNYIENEKEFEAKIVDGKHEADGQPILYGEKKYGEIFYGQNKKVLIKDMPTKVGDLVEIDTGFSSTITARIIKQTYSLAGTVLAKQSVLR